MASTEQHYSLRWNDYTVKIVTAFQSLRDEEDFVDVTVACDGHHYSAHKMVLSACSPYFRSLLRANPCQHPIVILKDVGHIEMERLLEFMYNGEVNIAQDQLAAFLKTAENLKIRGLAGSSEDIDQIHSRDSSHHYISCGSGTGANGGASGRSSPTLSFIPSQGTADDIAGEGGANSHHHSDSPPNKRRKRISIPSAGHPESNSASHNTDSLVADGNTIEDATTATGRSSSGGLVDDDLRIDRRELKSEPSDSVGEVYSEPSEISGEPQHAGDGLDSRQPILYPLAAMPGHSGPSTSGQENLGSQEPGDVSALMAIANAVQATAPSDRPIKCPLCQSIIKQARNLRRHVLKRHLPAAQRGEITEADVKCVLERKLKAITVTPLTEDELRQVQQRTRRKGVKSPRKMKGIAALPADINGSNIIESEVTIRKLPQKKDKRDKGSIANSNVLQVSPGLAVVTASESGRSEGTAKEDILQEALASRDKDMDPQEEVMDLATSQQQLPPISVVVSQGAPTGLQVATQPMSLTVTQTASGVHARLPAEAALQAGVRLQAESPLPLHRDLSAMPPMAFEPQVTISESMATYHTTSPSQVLPQSSSPSPSASGYVPATYWSSPTVAGLPAGSFQPHQTVFSPAHSEYFTAGVHMARPSTLERMQQHRRKPYQ